MPASFNLIDQRWIPCEHFDGTVEELGLHDALADAHNLRGISAETPLETASLYRLLLAVLHRVFGPADIGAWFALWERGTWDAIALDAYWERWYDRFDLLHPDENKRFYQRRPPGGEANQIIHMTFSQGNNPALFSHITDHNYPGMSPAHAARAILVTQVFRPGGFISGQSDPTYKSGNAGPSQKGIDFYAEGNSLFETTLLNLWSFMDDVFLQRIGLQRKGDDAPAWELDDPIANGRALPLGYLDFLTWQSFRIWLGDPLDHGHIYAVMLGKGQNKVEDSVHDPFKHYIQNEKTGYRVLDFDENRALWRDSSAILEQAPSDLRLADKHPYVVTWLNTLLVEDYDEVLGDFSLITIVALGMSSNRAKIDFYRHEQLPLPTAYLTDPKSVTLLKKSLQTAEDVRLALYRAVYRLAEHLIAPDVGQAETRKPRREDVNPLVNHWNVEAQYWAALEPAFWQLVVDLPVRGEATLVSWYRFLIQTARSAYSEAETLAGPDVRALKAAAEGRKTLEWYLKELRKGIEEWQNA